MTGGEPVSDGNAADSTLRSMALFAEDDTNLGEITLNMTRGSTDASNFSHAAMLSHNVPRAVVV